LPISERKRAIASRSESPTDLSRQITSLGMASVVRIARIASAPSSSCQPVIDGRPPAVDIE
jgi:hypothetical protein